MQLLKNRELTIRVKVTAKQKQHQEQILEVPGQLETVLVTADLPHRDQEVVVSENNLICINTFN